MIACLACFEDRLASLVENTSTFRLFDIAPGSTVLLHELTIPTGDVVALGEAMKANGSDTLICGGISGSSRRLLAQHGITVHPWISGSVDDVLDALLRDSLAPLAMPGVRCAGMGATQGRGMGGGGRGVGVGGGGGRGMGGGGGRGVGGGGGRGMGGGGRGVGAGGGGRGMGGGGRGMSVGGRGNNPAPVQGAASGAGQGFGPCGLGLRRGRATGAQTVPANTAGGRRNSR